MYVKKLSRSDKTSLHITWHCFWPKSHQLKENLGYVYEEINQIGHDSFTYNVTLFFAKISPVKGKLSDKK